MGASRKGAALLLRFKNRVLGALAQLGERYNGIVEVSGSIPLGSTAKRFAGYLTSVGVPETVCIGPG